MTSCEPLAPFVPQREADDEVRACGITRQLLDSKLMMLTLNSFGPRL
jgi:hypothetical protein